MRVIRDAQVSQRELVVFFAATLGLSAAYVLLSPPAVEPGAGRDQAREWFRQEALVILWAPMLFALLVTARFRGKAGLAALRSRFRIRGISLRWWLIALLLPPAIHLVPAFSSGGFETGDVTAWLRTWVVNMAFLSAVMIGEELGWRGYALPALQARRSPLVASLLLGLLWGVWHFPVWFGLGYGPDAEIGSGIAVVLSSTVNTVALAIILTWLVNHTHGSVPLAMLYHGANNASLRLYGDTDSALPHVLAYAITVGVAALIVGFNRKAFLEGGQT